MFPTVPPNTWGARFSARAGMGYDEDLAAVMEMGFTILSSEPTSGEVVMYGYGPGVSVGKFTSAFDLKLRIPGKFFLMKEGSPLTVDEIRKWAPLSQLTF